MKFIKHLPVELSEIMTAEQIAQYDTTLNRDEDMAVLVDALSWWLADEIKEADIGVTTWRLSETEDILGVKTPTAPRFITQPSPIGAILQIDVESIGSAEWQRDIWVNLQVAKLIATGELVLDAAKGWSYNGVLYGYDWAVNAVHRIQAQLTQPLTYEEGFYIGLTATPWIYQARVEAIALFGIDPRTNAIDTAIAKLFVH